VVLPESEFSALLSAVDRGMQSEFECMFEERDGGYRLKDCEPIVWSVGFNEGVVDIAWRDSHVFVADESGAIRVGELARIPTFVDVDGHLPLTFSVLFRPGEFSGFVENGALFAVAGRSVYEISRRHASLIVTLDSPVIGVAKLPDESSGYCVVGADRRLNVVRQPAGIHLPDLTELVQKTAVLADRRLLLEEREKLLAARVLRASRAIGRLARVARQCAGVRRPETESEEAMENADERISELTAALEQMTERLSGKRSDSGGDPTVIPSITARMWDLEQLIAGRECR
jgi:hypothetical protein